MKQFSITVACVGLLAACQSGKPEGAAEPARNEGAAEDEPIVERASGLMKKGGKRPLAKHKVGPKLPGTKTEPGTVFGSSAARPFPHDEGIQRLLDVQRATKPPRGLDRKRQAELRKISKLLRAKQTVEARSAWQKFCKGYVTRATVGQLPLVENYLVRMTYRREIDKVLESATEQADPTLDKKAGYTVAQAAPAVSADRDYHVVADAMLLLREASLKTVAETLPPQTSSDGLDLEAVSCVFSPASPEMDNHVSVQFTVKNNHDEDLVFPWGVYHSKGINKSDGSRYSMGTNIATKIVPAGGTKVFYHSWSPYSREPGEVIDIKMVVDPDDYIAETNENNNEIDCPTVTMPSDGSYPDMIVQSASVNPAQPTAGNNVTISVTIKNQGEGVAYFDYPASLLTASGGFTGIYSSQYTGGTSVAPGESIDATLSSTAEACSLGEHTATLTVDPGENVEESNEGNNQQTVTYTVAPDPDAEIDLEAVSCVFDPAGPQIDDHVSVKFTVKNNGDQELTVPWGVYHSKGINKSDGSRYSMGTNIATKTVPAGGTKVFYHSWSPYSREPGEVIDIKMVADPDDYFDETNENNNEVDCPTVTMPGGGDYPDLTITSAVVQPANPSQSSGFTIAVTVENQGTGAAFFTYPSTILSATGFTGVHSNQYTGGTTIAAGETATYTVQPMVDAYSVGNHTVTLTLDPGSKVEESNENNNQTTVSYTVSD